MLFRSRLEALERGELIVHEPVLESSLSHLGALGGIERAGGWVFSRKWLDGFREDVHARLAATDPRDPGVDPPAAPWAAAIVPLLGVERRGSRLYLPGARPEAAGGEDLLAELAAAGPNPVKVSDARLARVLEQEGRLVRVGDDLAVSVAAYERARAALVDECMQAGKITLARFRDLLGVGRRSAQLLLERFDADGLTRRVGDQRVLRRAATRDP